MPAAAKLAVYLSSHGYGHAVRCGAVLARANEIRPLKLDVTGATPRWLWPEALDAATGCWYGLPADVGVVQSDDLHVDRDATSKALDAWAPDYDARVEDEARKLAAGYDLVVGDVPPLAFDAAGLAGVPAVALANFSWDWIYERMGLRTHAQTAARAYGHAAILVEAEPSAPMTAFGTRTRAGLIGRPPPAPRDELRRRLGVEPRQTLVLVGMRTSGDELVRLPSRGPDLVFAMAGGAAARPDVIRVPERTTFLDMLAASDVVVAKPGYGILGDVAYAGTRLLYTERSGFPEDEVLLRWLQGRPGCAPVAPGMLASGEWGEALRALLSVSPPGPDGGRGLDAAARSIIEVLEGRL